MSNARTDMSAPLDRFKRGIRNAMRRILDRHILGIWMACSALAAFSGPFGTYQHHSFLSALSVWAVLLGVAIIIAFTVFEVCLVMFAHLGMAQLNIRFVAVGSVSIALVIDIMLTYWFDRPAEVRPGFIELWAYVVGIMLVIVLVRFMVPSFDRAMGDTGPQQDPVIPPANLPPHSRLAQRLDIPQGRRIIHISADGHFVEVQTCKQTHRIRMRFSDAVAELDETIGLIVHRSHWVHRDAVCGWVPSAAKPYVVLENGTEIPISKTYFDKVEAAGVEVLDTVAD